MTFQGIRTSITRKPYKFVIFQRGSRPPVPRSGSTLLTYIAWKTFWSIIVIIWLSHQKHSPYEIGPLIYERKCVCNPIRATLAIRSFMIFGCYLQSLFFAYFGPFRKYWHTAATFIRTIMQTVTIPFFQYGGASLIVTFKNNHFFEGYK